MGRLLAAALVLPGVLLLAARGAARWVLFPTHAVDCPPAPPDYRLWSALADDGVRVHALELDGRPSGPVVVRFHNNRETAAHGAALGRDLAARGFGVVLVEFRGYGLSSGAAPTEAGIYLDAEAVLRQLAARGVGPDRVVLWGHSLGTGVAAEMARRGRGQALVLVAPYTSIPDLVTDVFPPAPARLLLSDVFDTLGKAASIRARTVIVHGDADEVVPFWMGARLAHAIRGARLVRVAGGRHGDLFARERTRLLSEVAALTERPDW